LFFRHEPVPMGVARQGSGREGSEVIPNFIPHAAKERQARLFGALKKPPDLQTPYECARRGPETQDSFR
jgi:hypothetical protein